jgi:hypothetical protein
MIIAIIICLFGHAPIPLSANWSSQAELTQNGSSQQGVSVSLSNDGNTVAIGAPYYDAYQYTGAVQIYSRSGTQWQLQGTISQKIAQSLEGSSVALSSDCSTLATGAPRYNNNTGAAQIYVQSNTLWQNQATLSLQEANALAGSSIALSADGNTLAIGAPSYKQNIGATFIYIRSGTTWSYQSLLTQQIVAAYEGSSVALSADGTILAAAAPGEPGVFGATQIYTLIEGQWVHQATLSQINQLNRGCQSVSLSADGTTLAASNYGYNNNTGITFIYTLSGSTWSQQTTLSQNSVGSFEGTSVSLSADGNTVAVGATNLNGYMGGTQIYSKVNNVWTYQATTSQKIQDSEEGSAVSLSGDGSTLAVGAPFFNSTQGVTNVYVN